MRIAYFDCFSGASGDMILGACLDAGVDLDVLRTRLGALRVEGYSVHAEAIRKQGFAATQFDVRVDPSTDKPHRHLKHIREILDRSELPPSIRDRALAIFTRLGEAEAAVHGTTIEKVHFHEVGAIDAIVDIVGACIALDHLGVDAVECSPVPTGSGTVQCDHGIMPVPTPATARLLQGVPLAETGELGELTTPTGAAILTTLARRYGPLPAMSVERIGVGAGRRDGKTRANILRLLVGTVESTPGSSDEFDEVVVLETNLDDISGEVIGYVQDRLFEAGALDTYVVPIYMKKNRPAAQLTVLAPPALRERMESILLEETTTLGVRGHIVRRRKLRRSSETVQTPLGPVRIKLAAQDAGKMRASAEYEDCREIARRTGRPLIEVMNLAMDAWRAQADRSPLA